LRNRNINDSDTEYDGGKTVNLASSRSNRQLINLPNEYRPKDKNMSYNEYFKNNELENKTYSHVIPRSNSVNKLETNYNYSRVRNQLDAPSSKSYSNQKYEINNFNPQIKRLQFTNHNLNKIHSNYNNNSVNDKIAFDEVKENSYKREENRKVIKNYSRNYSKELNINEERNSNRNDRNNLETYSSHKENSAENRNISGKIDRTDYLYRTSLASTNYYRNNLPKSELKMYDTSKYNPKNEHKFIKRDEVVRRRNLDTTYETKNDNLTKNKVSLVLRTVNI
jgi:hypothetical protein